MGIAEIVEVLGGNKTFKHPIRSADELAEQVRSGLPASTVTLLAAILSLQRAQVAERLQHPAAYPQPQACHKISSHSRRVGQNAAHGQE